jgi:hypothetical protein
MGAEAELAGSKPYGKGELIGMAVEPILGGAQPLRRIGDTEQSIGVGCLDIQGGGVRQKARQEGTLQAGQLAEERGDRLQRDMGDL